MSTGIYGTPPPLLYLFGLVFLLSIGCDSGGGASNAIELTPSELPASAGSPSAEVWQSSGWDADWIAYPGDTLLRVPHGLGRAPVSVEAYVSFSQNGFAAGVASGDLARIVSVDGAYVAIETVHSNNSSSDSSCDDRLGPEARAY